VVAVSAASVVNGKRSLIIFSGRDVQPGQPTQLLSDAYCLDVRSQKWSRLPTIEIDGKPRCVMAGSAISVDGRILLLGGDTGENFSHAELLRNKGSQDELAKLMESHRGFSSSIIQFDPSTKAYSVIGRMPEPSPVTTPCGVWNDGVALISGEIRAGVRTPKAWLMKLHP
jgi:N-acetylneuraminic acid mutarotase